MERVALPRRRLLMSTSCCDFLPFFPLSMPIEFVFIGYSLTAGLACSTSKERTVIIAALKASASFLAASNCLSFFVLKMLIFCGLFLMSCCVFVVSYFAFDTCCSHGIRKEWSCSINSPIHTLPTVKPGIHFSHIFLMNLFFKESSF